MESVRQGDRKSRFLNLYGPAALFTLSLFFFTVSIIKGWHGSIIDMHGFRQTQTAITVRYILEGGPWIAYETPLFGPPWSIPFEFPLYQWIVALIVKTGILPLIQAGRIVSIISFLFTLYPIYKILEVLKQTKRQIYMILTLCCLSPMYIFWSRTFMIESTALALSTYYLWLVVKYFNNVNYRRKNLFLLFGFGFIGSLAGTVKITTFFAFMACSYLFWGGHFYNNFKRDGFNKYDFFKYSIKFLIFATIIPFMATLLWTSYADSLKSLNPMGKHLTSSSLSAWNFGTLSQKLSLDTWKVFLFRNVSDIIGNCWLLLLYALAVILCSYKSMILSMLSFLIFALPLLTFTNLHSIHNYYSYANGIFLIVATGIISSNLVESRNYFKQIIGIIIFCLTTILSLSHYSKDFRPIQGIQNTDKLLEVKKDIDKYTKGNDIILVLGADWSSEIPFYLHRKAVMVPNWMSLSLYDQYFTRVNQNLKKNKVGAILFCYEFQKLPDRNPSFLNYILSEFNIQNDYIIKEHEQITAYFLLEGNRSGRPLGPPI